MEKWTLYYKSCDNCDNKPQKIKVKSLETPEGTYYSCYKCLVYIFGVKEASRQWNNMKNEPARCGWCDETKDKCIHRKGVKHEK